MNSINDTIVRRTKDLVSESKLDTPEGCATNSVWGSRITSYLCLCHDWLAVLGSEPNVAIEIPVELSLLIGGIIGNQFTSSLLHPKPDLGTLVKRLLESLMAMHHVHSIRSLLLCSPVGNRTPDITYASRILKSCMVHIARDLGTNREDSLNYLPLYRDCLVWLVHELDYPELAGEQFISVLQPLGLRLTEDYRPPIQIAGLRVLRNLGVKARISDWRQSGRAEAVMSQLTQFRIGSGPHGSDQLLDEVYLTLSQILSLVNLEAAPKWYEQLTERLLQDLLMESRRTKQLVLLRHLNHFIDLLKSSFALHTRSFLRVLSAILLGPRRPHRKSQPDSVEPVEEQVYVLILNCLYKYINVAWPILVPGLGSDLLGPLIAFIDLLSNSPASNTNLGDSETASPSDTISNQLTEILNLLINLDSRLLSDVLKPACTLVPSLANYFPK